MPLTTEQLSVLRSAPLPSTGNKLSLAMELADRVTQTAVAAALGFTVPYVSDVVRGRYRTITIENAWKFATYFGCEPGELFPAREAVAS